MRFIRVQVLDEPVKVLTPTRTGALPEMAGLSPSSSSLAALADSLALRSETSAPGCLSARRAQPVVSKKQPPCERSDEPLTAPTNMGYRSRLIKHPHRKSQRRTTMLPWFSAGQKRPAPTFLCVGLPAPLCAIASATPLTLCIATPREVVIVRVMQKLAREAWLKLALLGLVLMTTHAQGQIFKVLPQYLDGQERAALSPSLFDRDAYQAELRRNPNLRSTMRFQILWKPLASDHGPLRLRLELRGWSTAGSPRQLTLEQTVPTSPTRRRWTSIRLTPDQYRQLGDVTAWRVSLWSGPTLLAEQRSFLWTDGSPR